MQRAVRIWCGSLIASLALACSAPAPQAVKLSDSWPSSTRSYGETTRDWTRHGKAWQGFAPIIEVHATFASPEWRAAYVAERARRERLSGDAHAALLAAEQQAAGDYYDVQLIVATHDERENDLAKGSRSIWRVALVDDQGNQVTPISIKRDRRPDETIRAYFPAMHELADAYIARFPKDVAVLRNGATRFALRVSSARGSVELVWPAQR
jgi:hypothetical protein